ncbi:Alpha/beta hydrolase fold-3 domain protein [Gluconacetobacter diazotrophicus PA1 5]|uniref:Alpha/beta hydrolase n=2 Tax=Gluconacetobacter diazotrophicus TaxID=33996 RepID=A0A7W4NP27_GLUDI|nr:Alpha/beta hydrolase fold-3 domain protein [Gluconacetobacter diazotrophicus PA1 5]MBB2157890.1 alpha/beta hydrolase [Gluconacetobacter diazotrophicus]TWB08945.1 acetyl esterase [Gluconacetobacter diazotrophicus]
MDVGPAGRTTPGLAARLLLRHMTSRARQRAQVPHTLESLRQALDRPCFPQALSSLPLRRVLAVRVPGATELRPARLYVPRGRVRGVVLFLHGGGFVHCGLNSHHGICCRLARASGAAVLSYDYRLSPEHRFPGAVEDCLAALDWLAGEAWRWGGPIAVAGDSAGGNLAAVLALLARDRGGPDLALQLLYYPSLYGERDVPSRHRYAEGYMLTTRLMEWYAQQYIRTPDDLRHPLMAPIHADSLAGLPPAVIVPAQCDPLHDEATGYAAALREAGGQAEVRCYPGTIHGYLNLYSFMPWGKAAIRFGGKRLRAAFAGQDPVRSAG